MTNRGAWPSAPIGPAPDLKNLCPNFPMPQHRTLLFVSLLFLLLGLTACVSLAEDITPPPGYQPPTAAPRTPTTSAPVYPVLPPDPARGAPLYAQNCAACHGKTGLGDGPGAADLPNPPAPLGDPALARQAAPNDWYLMVTNGDLSNFMPPFSSLSVPERWDVIAYAYTLSTTPEEIARGQELYTANCSDCHGERGQGDGPKAGKLSTSPVDFTNQEYVGAHSAADLFTAVSEGVSGTEMHAFEALPEDDIWALTAFLRTLMFAKPTPESGLTETPEDAASPELTPTPLDAGSETPDDAAELAETGAVTITVISISGDALPTDVDVILRLYEGMTEVYTTAHSLPADGIIRVTDVPLQPDQLVFATFEHESVIYGSNIASTDEGLTTLNLTLSYYGRTDDLSALTAERLHIFFDFIGEDVLQVYALYIFSNESGRVLASGIPDEPAVIFTLPEGAENLVFDVGQSFDAVETEDGFGLLAVYPGQEPYQVLYSFDMPYEGHKAEIDLPVALDTSAVIAMIPEGGVKIKSDQLADAGMRDFEGVAYSLYNGGNLNAGASLLLSISGIPDAPSPPGSADGADTRTGLMIGLAALGVAMIGVGIYFWARTRSDNDEDMLDADFPADNPEELMDAIIVLDDLFRDGEIPEDAYRQRRAALKEYLLQMLDEA